MMAAALDPAAHHPNESAQILVEAGSDPSLLHLTTSVNSNKAPIELLGEFLRCLMNEEYKAARLLCNKVLELESNNVVAREFVSTIEERIRLDEELETESSSSESTSSGDSNNSSSSGSTEEESDDCSTEQHDEHRCHHGNSSL